MTLPSIRSAPEERPKAADAYRVMVVDDSAVIRGLLTRALENDPEISVVASVGDGLMALKSLGRQPIDVIVLDIEMPVMDGLTALPKLIAASPSTKVIMASTLTKRNADISLKALEAGAADYIPKPSSARDILAGEVFRRDLVSKVKALGAAAHRNGGPAAARARAAAGSNTRVLRPLRRPAAGPIRLRPMPATFQPEVVAIGSSTGGPQALFEVLTHCRGGIAQPVVITQHMPPMFTTILAEHITRQCGIQTAEAADGEVLLGRRCYIAPGGFHMTVRRESGRPVIRLNQDPPENFCRPAVDPLLRSLAASCGRNVLAVILTGMGQDGMLGARAIVKAGGALVAQDEASSVVWGMPGAVAADGICNAVLPVKEIGPLIRKLTMRSAA